jgi:protein O-mannosyl-transferase
MPGSPQRLPTGVTPGPRASSRAAEVARLGSSPSGADFWKRSRQLLPWLLLAAATLAVYWPVTGFDFVDFDDNIYLTHNPHVIAGISWGGLKWALGSDYGANWHPLTWASHMLDCQLFGPRAGYHHLTSLLLHLANAGLLFALLLRMTGRRGASFVVAALFAWHPLHVESVAWVAERKDVLSTFFGLFCLWAYVRYAQSAQCGARGAESRNHVSRFTFHTSRLQLPSSSLYLLALACFALGLMSKPMLVTLPFVLLLLDYWPLGRGGKPGMPNKESAEAASRPWARAWTGLALEKAPFLVLAAASCGVTLWAQRAGGAIVATQSLPVAKRIANAVLAYYGYLGKTLWPSHLAVFYPHSSPSLSVTVVLAAAALGALTLLLVWLRRLPFLAVGWLWYLGMLVPVIGLVQVGSQAMADRYTYLPMVGLLLLGVYGLRELWGRFRGINSALVVLATLVLAGCLVGTRRQVMYWRNGETLFRHTMAVTRDNYTAYNGLGFTLASQGRYREALEYYQAALRAFPGYVGARVNLADCYRDLKQPREAIPEYQAALTMDWNNARTHYFLANALLAVGDTAGALEHYRAGVLLEPDHAALHYQLGTVLLGQGRIEEGQEHLREAVRLKPDWEEALNNLACSLTMQPEARFRNGSEALQLASRAVALTHTNSACALDTLAGALAEVGRFPEAVQAVQGAARLARTAGDGDLERQIQEHLRRYERGQTYREPAIVK